MLIPFKLTAQFLVAWARKRPLPSLVALVATMIGISDVGRGHERTVCDLERIAARLRDFFTISPTVRHSMERIELGRLGYWYPTIRYPAKLIEIFIKGHRENRDILADFAALERAWNDACPDRRLTIRFIRPTAFDPMTGVRIAESIHPPEPIDNVNFQAMLPLLRDIRDLILESEDGGDGYGKLPISGFQAEPSETDSDAHPFAVRPPSR